MGELAASGVRMGADCQIRIRGVKLLDFYPLGGWDRGAED
jgi:hypothetical protein